MIGCMARTGSSAQSEKRKQHDETSGKRSALLVVLLGLSIGATVVGVGSIAKYTKRRLRRVIVLVYGKRPK